MDQVCWVKYNGLSTLGPVYCLNYIGSSSLDQVHWIRYTGSGTLQQVQWGNYTRSNAQCLVQVHSGEVHCTKYIVPSTLD